MAHIQKIHYVKKLSELFGAYPHFLIINYDRLPHTTLEELRGKLRDHNGTYFKVVKNSLFRVALDASKNRASQDAEVKPLYDSALLGSTAVLFLSDDWVSPLKTLYTFAKDFEHIDFKIGVIEDKTYGQDMLTRLAQLPSKEELYGKILGSLKSPQTRFVYSLSYTMGRFARVLNGIGEKKQTEAN